MPISTARLLANRRNALKSTGPRTEEGKARSRQNAYKHGLTSQGDVLPEADAAELARRSEALHNDFQPTSEAGRILLRRFAFLSIRLEKCEQFDASYTAKRVRHAVEIFDDNRQTDVEELVMHIASDPMTVTRRLRTSAEGVEWLLRQWAELREDLVRTDRQAWTLNHWSRFEQLQGLPGGNFRITRTQALTQGLNGFFNHLDPTDGEGLDDTERAVWARAELTRLIDAETAGLRELLTTFDPEILERDRAEAPSRALFDPSPELILARKYEAATERAMYKALDRFHEVELAALEAGPIEEVEEPLASFEPAEENGEEPAGSVLRREPIDEPTWPRPALEVAAKRETRPRRRVATFAG